jgi:hypothetical protein
MVSRAEGSAIAAGLAGVDVLSAGVSPGMPMTISLRVDPDHDACDADVAFQACCVAA